MMKKKLLFSFRPLKWISFIKEIHPVFPNITFCYIGFISFYLFVLNFLKIGTFSWLNLIIGSSTYASVLLCLRAFDELKDQELDVINFPDRPLVKGTVSRPDLYTLTSFLLLIPLAIHLLVYKLTLPSISYIFVLIFSFLIYKWFYIKEFLKSRLFWALITHNPIVYIIQFYTLSFLFNDLKTPLNRQTTLITLAFALTGTAWEISRKLRQPEEETEYTTYTKIWGREFSTSLVLFILYTSFGLFFYISKDALTESHKWMIIPFAIPVLTLIYVTLQGRSFLKGRLKGVYMRQNIELFMASLAISALILGSLPCFIN